MKNQKYMFILGAALALMILLAVVYRIKPEGFVGGGGAGTDTFTLYYADWCPHCKTVKPIFKDWSKKGSVTINGKPVFLSMVEADTDAEKLKGKPVKGFPTFLLEKSNGKFVEFDGERTPSGWESWLASNL